MPTTSVPTPSERGDLAAAIYALGASVVRRIPRELSLTAISTMATLERTGPRRITDLAAVQGVSQPSMTSMIASLEAVGHVERRSDPADRRVTRVALTASGVRALGERRRAATDSILGLVDQLDEDDAARLLAALPALARLHDLDEQERERQL